MKENKYPNKYSNDVINLIEKLKDSLCDENLELVSTKGYIFLKNKLMKRKIFDFHPKTMNIIYLNSSEPNVKKELILNILKKYDDIITTMTYKHQPNGLNLINFNYDLIDTNPDIFKDIYNIIKSVQNDKLENIKENNENIDVLEIESIYECVLDDYETMLKIYKNDEKLISYKTEKCNSFTYFMHNNNSKIKIGKTGNIVKRLNQLKTANPDIYIELILPNDSNEKILHKKFHIYHSSFEWYHYAKEIIDFVKCMKNRNKKAIECYEKYLENVDESPEKYLELVELETKFITIIN